MPQKRIELILQQLEQLPTLPAVATAVLSAASDDQTSASQISALISSDPALTARVLQLVHSADSGVRGQVNTVERAVVLLGFERVRCAVLALSVFELFSDTRPAAHRSASQSADQPTFSRNQFWHHCIGVACCAELLAEALAGQVDPGEAFVCGLLHDLGKVALDATLPKSFARAVETAELLRTNIADLERSIIGLDHMVVGKRLAETWKLPPVIRDCIWLHGQDPQALPPNAANPLLINLVTLADTLIRRQHIGYSGNYLFPLPIETLAVAIGLSTSQIDHVVHQLMGRIEPRSRALGLNDASADELYLQAMAQANKELGRIGRQLANRNLKLTARAQYFDVLSQFHSELPPDATSQAALSAIGKASVGVLQASSAAVFSIPPNRDWAEVLMVDQAGEVFEQTLLDLVAPPAKGAPEKTVPGTVFSSPQVPPAGEGPVFPVASELEGILSVVSPRLGHTQRFWICLAAEGRCIGGVIWGAPPGEGQRLSPQVAELSALAGGWGIALRAAQVRDEARLLAENLAQANRQVTDAQAELLRSRTLVSVGEMAAGAAHEMNNPLAVISGRSQLLARELQDPRHKAAAHLVCEQCHRLSHILSELMDFARPEKPKPEVCDLSELLDAALHQAKTRCQSADTPDGQDLPLARVELTVSDVPTVRVDPQQLAAALAEVLANALQATDPAKGAITVHAACDSNSQRVVLTVSDEGAGMDELTLKHSFDPFFSAKSAGRRRGMGLAKAMRWIEGSGGTIRLESRPGHGTRATVVLPVATKGAIQQLGEGDVSQKLSNVVAQRKPA
jgi:putative nucleotidyltransferase with HDIG domain